MNTPVNSVKYHSARFEQLRDLVYRQWQQYGQDNALDGLRLSGAFEPSGVIRAVYQTSFCVVLQGSKVSSLGDTDFHYHSGQCLFASVNVPVNARIMTASPETPYLAFSLEIDPAMVAELLLQHPDTLSGSRGNSALSVSDVPEEVLEPLIRLLTLLDQPQDSAVLAPLIRREICWRLLRSPLGPVLQQVGLRDSETARIGKVAAWIRSHYQEAIRVGDLAAMASMSSASFHRHFKAITQLTPVQFQKRIRLQEARRLLLSEHEVASVGYQVGYESPSQFSRDYRKLFGAPPGKDRAVMRSSVAIETVR